MLLSELAKDGKEIHYYALDISDVALFSSLQVLKAEFKDSPQINISGLIGTYQDCVEWITESACFENPSVTFLWVGNSIANLSKPEASVLISKFRHACASGNIECRFLVSADSCRVTTKILKAYSPHQGLSRKFLLHGLRHCNWLFSTELFDKRVWECIVDYDEAENELLSFYTPKMNFATSIGGTPVAVRQGERILFFRSGKWSEAQMTDVAQNAGFRTATVWSDREQEYSKSIFQVLGL
jgi:uncharacterized SAM-dependent methyltransferase